MTTTTYAIAATNKDAQWNWNGFGFDESGRGDSTTIPCEKAEWKAAMEAFKNEFDPASAATLRLIESTFDDETEETAEEILETLKA